MVVTPSIGIDASMAEASPLGPANKWSIFPAPDNIANIHSIAVSKTHIWLTDENNELYYSAIGGTEVQWQNLGQPASQITVSPSGHIVWRLDCSHDDRVFAGTKVTHSRPGGMKWVEILKNVAFVSVDEHSAWYTKKSGEVKMQKGLSKERQFSQSLDVKSLQVQQVIARHDVVWAISKSHTLMVRQAITADTPEGKGWVVVNRETEPFRVLNATIDDEGRGWAVDLEGRLWSTDQICPTSPAGSGNWQQVPSSKYFIPDSPAEIQSNKRSALIGTNAESLWLSLDSQKILHVYRGSLQELLTP